MKKQCKTCYWCKNGKCYVDVDFPQKIQKPCDEYVERKYINNK